MDFKGSAFNGVQGQSPWPFFSAVAWLAGAYLAFALRTTRWTLHGGSHLERFARDGAAGDPGEGAVIAFWHEGLACSGALLGRIRRVARGRAVSVVVSRNRDGRLIAAALRRFKVNVLFGSTARTDGGHRRDKGGAAALRSMLRRLAAGELVAITPDGPRGPARAGRRRGWRRWRRCRAARCCRLPGRCAGGCGCAAGTGCRCRCRSGAGCWFACRRSWWRAMAGGRRCRGLRRR